MAARRGLPWQSVPVPSLIMFIHLFRAPHSLAHLRCCQTRLSTCTVRLCDSANNLTYFVQCQDFGSKIKGEGFVA